MATDPPLIARLLESDEFVDAMQRYRVAPRSSPSEVIEAFRAVKELIRATALRAGPEPTIRAWWQPIETAPKDGDLELWFWVRGKTLEEAYVDTSGDPIFGSGPPHLHIGKYGTWCSLEKATQWMRPQWPDPPSDEGAVQAQNDRSTSGRTTVAHGSPSSTLVKGVVYGGEVPE